MVDQQPTRKLSLKPAELSLLSLLAPLSLLPVLVVTGMLFGEIGLMIVGFLYLAVVFTAPICACIGIVLGKLRKDRNAVFIGSLGVVLFLGELSLFIYTFLDTPLFE